MRVHPSKRAFLRRFPAPALPPEGMMWHQGRLVTVQSVHDDAAARMANHDAQSEERRRKARGLFTGEIAGTQPAPDNSSQ